MNRRRPPGESGLGARLADQARARSATVIDVASIATVIRRELVTGLRSGASFGLLLAGMLVMNLVASLCVMEAESNVALSAGAFRSLYTLQIRLYEIFAFLILPAVATLSVQSERTAETQELVATTLIRPGDLLLGKYIAVLCRAALLAFAFLPFTGLVYFYAGVDVLEACRDGIRLAAAAIVASATGLWAGTFIKKPYLSVFFAYVFMVAPIAPLTFGLWVFENVIATPSTIGVPAADTAAFSGPFLIHLAVLGLIAMLYLIHTFTLAGKALSMEAPERARHNVRKPKFRAIPDGTNPFAWRDRYGSALHLARHQILIVVGVLNLYGMPVALVFPFSPSTITMLYEMERLAMLAFVPPLVALALTRDRDPVTMADYQLTLWKSTDVLWGKLRGVATLVAPLVVAMTLVKIAVAACTVLLLDRQVTARAGVVPDFPLVAVLEPFNFIHHLLVALLASALGAAAPRALLPAILGAYLACLVCGVVTLAVSLESVLGLSTNAVQASGYFLAYGVVHGFMCVMIGGFAGAVFTAHWGHAVEHPLRATERGY